MLPRHLDRRGGVRVEEIAVAGEYGADCFGGLVHGRAPGVELGADRGEGLFRDREAAGLPEALHGARHRLGVAVGRLEQQALEIGGYLDVHGRGGGLDHAPRFVDAGRQRAGEDVVVVGGDHQPLDRQPHPLGGVAGEDVAEIPGGHGEGYRPFRRTERECG